MNYSSKTNYFRYVCQTNIKAFSVQLSAWNTTVPKFMIRYSVDSGANYTILLDTNNTWLSGYVATNYRLFESGNLNISPASSEKIFLEIFSFATERLMEDNFSVTYY